MEVALNGVALREAPSSASTDCWKRLEVPASLWSGRPGPVEVTVAPRTSGVELVAGYVPPRAERSFVELRVFARDGRLVEIWS